MQGYNSPKTNFLFFLVMSITLLTSCTKEHDLVSDFVVAEKIQLQRVAEETNSAPQPSASTRLKQGEGRTTTLGK